jgi:hypothetical protein
MESDAQAVAAAALVARLQAHSHDPDEQAQCCYALCENGLLLTSDECLVFVPVIVAALRTHPGHADLQMNGCAALGCVYHGDYRSEELLARATGVVDGIRAVVDALRAHPASAELQYICCGVLQLMTKYEGLRGAAVDAGAVQVVVAALRAHALCKSVNIICDALSELTEEHPLAMAQAGAAGGVAATVAAMRAHPASAMVQTAGCSALGSLAYDAENQKKAIHAGAIEVILQALRTHHTDVEVQESGCRALGNIAEGHAEVVIARFLLLFDATKALVAALNGHRAETLVQQQACIAMFHLLPADVHRVEAGQIGAVKAVVAALRAHPADADVQEDGYNALGCLCTKTSANAVQACGAGALQAIVAGMRAHSAIVRVQMAGCDALDCLVKAHPRLQAAAGAAGAVEAVVDAMRMPAFDAELPKVCGTALIRLACYHAGNLQRACTAGAMELLAAAMSSSCAHEGTEVNLSLYDCTVIALEALLTSAGNDDAAQHAVRAGVLDIMAREGEQRRDPSVLAAHARLLSLLEAAAQRHDAAACAHDGCKRCAAARERGRICALAGCGARKRADGSGKRLLRCGACAVAAYCGAAHQRADYARHKAECAALGAASAQGEEQRDE